MRATRGSGWDTAWLLSENGHDYFPDYFLLNSIGGHTLLRRFNQFSSQYLGKFGGSYRVMRRLSTDMMMHHVSYCRRVGDSDGVDQLIESNKFLLTALYERRLYFSSWCLSEFFLFMVKWLDLICREYSISSLDINCFILDLN